MHWQERQEAKARQGVRLQFPLRVAVRMWPTGPGAAYPRETWPTPTKSVQRFPTPTVNDSKNNNPPSQALRNTPPLNVVVGGNMNPTWVEWLMGWPLGWTDLRPLEMDRFRQWCASHGAR